MRERIPMPADFVAGGPECPLGGECAPSDDCIEDDGGCRAFLPAATESPTPAAPVQLPLNRKERRARMKELPRAQRLALRGRAKGGLQ